MPLLPDIKGDIIISADKGSRGSPISAFDELVEDIKHLMKKEEQFISTSYMKKQTDINENMREILVDWIVEVHYKYQMKGETLFLAISLIDRFLEKRHVMRNKLQLVGVAALLIAGKYEEVYPPRVADCTYH
jgi:cyclin B